MTIVAEPDRQHILTRVQEALDRHQPRGYHVHVDPNGIVEDGGWYHVVVKSDNDQRDRDFYDAISIAETELNELDDGHDYLLVPAIAD